MKYTKKERLDIGCQVYTHELSHSEAVSKYHLTSSSIDKYVRLYKTENGIPTNTFIQEGKSIKSETKKIDNPTIEEYMAMTKEELIDQLILAKANELRAKKGYQVKGAGANKGYISLNSKNTK